MALKIVRSLLCVVYVSLIRDSGLNQSQECMKEAAGRPC